MTDKVSTDDGSAATAMLSDCECSNWGRDSLAAMLHLPHHPNCPKYSPEQPVRELLLQLIDGIEAWAADEDGVHSECWDAYVGACAAVGMWDRPSTREPV